MAKAELFNGITKEHIIQAIQRIDEEGSNPKRKSKFYDLVYNGTAYPPKYVLSLAAYFRNKKYITHEKFGGGENTAAFSFLRDHGFEILPKEQTKNYRQARENPEVEGKYLNKSEMKEAPEFFIKEDFNQLKKFSGQTLDRNNPKMVKTYDYLKNTYEKVEYWGKEVQRILFPEGDIHIVKKPTNQANKFEAYHWAKLYPIKKLKEWKILSYTLTFSSKEDFCVKIDTVSLGDNDPLRKKYFEYRGDYYNSPIIKFLKADEILATNWETLISRSVEVIKSLQGDYNKLLSLIGYSGAQPSPNSNSNYTIALNTILYGPPGTGKTYQLNTIKINDFIDKDVLKTKEEVLHEKLLEFPFWQVLGAALYASQDALTVNEIVSHPIVKARIKPGIKTKPNNLAWADLQSYADDESTGLASKYRRSIKLFHKNTDGGWSIAMDKVEDIEDIIDPELIELAQNSDSVKATAGTSEVHRYRFITFHQKYSYEDFIEGIKPMLRDSGEDKLEEEGGRQLVFELRKGIFYLSCLEALKLAGYNSFDECIQESKEERKAKFDLTVNNRQKQFALFIDEINRANISAVFGELITLIEENKRLGQEEEMWLKLPYSNEDFGVPPNLYLIGSMNTADRSIALLDIALRRRFEFVGLYPDYKLIPLWAETLKAINDKIYALKKNPDFFIGHAFFIKKELTSKKDIFNKKIIPLLMEYFQNNPTTVKVILDAGKVEIEEPSITNNYQLIAIN